MKYTVENILVTRWFSPEMGAYITLDNGTIIKKVPVTGGREIVDKIYDLHCEFKERVKAAYRQYSPAEREELAAHLGELADTYGHAIARLEDALEAGAE